MADHRTKQDALQIDIDDEINQSNQIVEEMNNVYSEFKEENKFLLSNLDELKDSMVEEMDISFNDAESQYF